MTEPAYLAHLNAQLRTSGVTVEIAQSGRDPISLVHEAIRRRDEESRQARMADDAGNIFDTVWVMFDVDDFTAQIPQALMLADRNDIRYALSNPCFEIWLVWHISDADAHLSSRQAQHRAALCGVTQPSELKAIEARAISGQFALARERAMRVARTHDDVGRSFPDDNPRSDVYRLVDQILEGVALARPGEQLTL